MAQLDYIAERLSAKSPIKQAFRTPCASEQISLAQGACRAYIAARKIAII